MARIVVINHLTLDGVMQSPGRPEEDTRGGFAHGGWGSRNSDEEMLRAVYARVNESGGLRLLLGRWTYEEMLGYWNTEDSPFKEGLNSAPKYVASRTLREPLRWPNSTLLKGEAGDAVAELKQQADGKWRADRDADGSRPDRRVPARHPPARARHGSQDVR